MHTQMHNVYGEIVESLRNKPGIIKYRCLQSIHYLEEENQFHQVVLWLPQVFCDMCNHKQINAILRKDQFSAIYTDFHHLLPHQEEEINIVLKVELCFFILAFIFNKIVFYLWKLKCQKGEHCRERRKQQHSKQENGCLLRRREKKRGGEEGKEKQNWTAKGTGGERGREILDCRKTISLVVRINVVSEFYQLNLSKFS